MENGVTKCCYSAIPNNDRPAAENEQQGSGREMSSGADQTEQQKKAFPWAKRRRRRFAPMDAVRYVLPILEWAPAYSIRANLHSDLVTGLTVGIMVVPQGMAYATLAGVEPVYGLYSCFFSALFYMFFGTSRHISIGTFAVASMMVGSVCAKFLPPISNNNGTSAGEMIIGNDGTFMDDKITPLVLTSTLTFGVGCFQLLFALFRLSSLTDYFSDSLISGFTTGAAVHVLTSQMDKLIGVKINRYSGVGMVILMWRELALASPRANLLTLAISALGLTFLSLGRLSISPLFSRHFRIPFPLELFLVIIAILFSSIFSFKDNHGVQIVDNVPEGMPLPSLPRFELLLHIWPSVVSIAIICYIFVFSLGRIFAKKHNYAVNANRELSALGLSSLLSSFFPVYPCGASLSRSSLCEMTGAKTQLHALFSSALLLVVILWIGAWLEPLPMAILACIVTVSLRPLFMQFGELPNLWRTDRYEFFVWLVAFFGTAFLNITFGLALSLLFSLAMFGLRKLNDAIATKGRRASPESSADSERQLAKLPQIVNVRLTEEK
ncbi:hypothetical protein niasHT_000388 [Heterodera trifolii]|uniref:SLC26A/SulP transporter domain-containing protein n=1 Tax=Heterodera trifolii TaxID=157864 RepID=A0ABD2M141_9BILA